MGDYTFDYMQHNFAVGGCDDYGPSWWGHLDLARHFGQGIPESVALEMIGFTPINVPMMYVDPDRDGTPQTFGGNRVVLRSDTRAPIGMNGGTANLFNYRDWFLNGPKQMLNTMDLYLGFVGVFKGGAMAAVQVELAKVITDEFSGVAHKPFIYFASSLDGSIRPQCGAGVTRMVCDNTFRMGVNEAKAGGLFYSVKQTRNARPDWNQAREALDIVSLVSDQVKDQYRALCEVSVTDRQWFDFLDAYTPLPEVDATAKNGKGRSWTIADNKRQALGDLWASDERVSPWKGTAFGVSQAVTTHAQHFATIKGAPRIERHKRSMIDGDSTAVERSALTVLGGVLGRELVTV